MKNLGYLILIYKKHINTLFKYNRYSFQPITFETTMYLIGLILSYFITGNFKTILIYLLSGFLIFINFKKIKISEPATKSTKRGFSDGTTM